MRTKHKHTSIEFADAHAAGFKRASDLSEDEFAAALADETTQWWRPDGRTLLVRRNKPRA